MIVIKSKEYGELFRLKTHIVEQSSTGEKLLPIGGSTANFPAFQKLFNYLKVVSRDNFNPQLRNYEFDKIQAELLRKMIVEQTVDSYENSKNPISEAENMTQTEKRLKILQGNERRIPMTEEITMDYYVLQLLRIANYGPFSWTFDGGESELGG
jgi:hypothetical protein